MKIKFKIISILGIAILIAFTLATVAIIKLSSDSTERLAYQLTKEMAYRHSAIVQRELEQVLGKARGLELSFVELFKAQITNRQLIDNMLIEAVKRDEDILGVWTLWEPNAFDGQDATFANTAGYDESGRVNAYWYRDKDNQILKVPNVNWETADYYQHPKQYKQGMLLNPHIRTITGSPTLIISATVPIIYQDVFLGVVGVDYKHEALRQEIAEISILGTGYAALIANNGTVVAHFNNDYVGKNWREINASLKTFAAIQQGEQFVTLEYSKLLKTEVYRIYTPINVGKTRSPWSLMITLPLHIVLKPVSDLIYYIVLFGGIAIVIIGLILLITIDHITRPLAKMVNTLEKMVDKGLEVTNSDKLTVTSNDEVGKLADTFNRLFQKLENEFTERTKALHDLSQFKTTLDMTLDAIFMLDTETLKFVYLNQGFINQVGYSEKELLQMEIMTVKPAFTETQFRDMTTELLEGDEMSKTYETVYRHKNGHLIPVEVYLQHIQVSSKQPEVFLVISRDISERKRMEKQLRESEANYRAIVEDQTELVCRFNLDGTLAFVNEAYCRYFNKTREELVGHSFTPNIPSEDLQNVATAFLALCREHPVVTVQHRVILEDGTIHWHEWTNRMVLDNEDNFLEYLGVGRDITERKQVEEQLIQTSLRLTAILESTGDAICALDRDYRYLAFNSAYKKRVKQVFNIEPQIGGTVLNAMSEFDRTKSLHHFNRALLGESFIIEEIYGDEARYRTYFELAYNPIFDSHRLPIGVTLFIRDISERKRAEFALQEAKEAAEVANQAKSTFLANMSHELRTPLNSVLGYAQILAREKSLTPKQKEGINIIQRSGEYLLTLINDVLDLSKIEAGKIELYLVDFDFNEFISTLTELFQMRAQQKGIAFIYEPLTHLPTGLHADEKRLRQVLINLLGNAVKFTDKGGVTFKIGYNAGKMRFQIEDTGVGIAAEDVEQIFKPFQQVGNNLYKAEGTGLGLPITKRLVEMMGGELHVESTIGEGSVFWTELALSESTVVKPKREKSPTIVGFEGVPRKILVIDDKKENRSVMVNLLTPLGFEVSEAGDGQEGIDKIKIINPDLVLIDLVMPVMDGFEATRQIRTLQGFENLPIIAASASVFDFHQQESKGAGCDDFMAKPFHADELFALLKKHLKLTWLYDEEEIAQNALNASEIQQTVDAPFVDPSSEQATLLLDLAMMGDIAGIMETADKFEQENKQLTPFLDRIRQLAKNFAEEDICKLVEPYVKNTQ